MPNRIVEPVGEVVEASTKELVVQCHRPRLYAPPEIGTFVRILPPSATPEEAENEATCEDPFLEPSERIQNLKAPLDTLYALVVESYITSADPGRRAVAYGLEEERLRAEQPQIFHLLTSEFRAVPFAIMGSQGQLKGGYPSVPPRLHAFVYACTKAEVLALSELPDLPRRLLFLPNEPAPDAVVVACLRHAYAARGDDFEFLVRMGKQLAVLLRSETDRLNALLRDLEP